MANDAVTKLFSQQGDANRPFQLQKCGQLFIGAHDETLSVAMRVADLDPAIMQQ
jgi:hypothetical protein